MSNFDETVIRRLTALEREVERLRVWERPAGGSGVTDHGALTGLADDDHPQYLLTTGKAADSDKLDGIDSTGFATATHSHDHGALTGLEDDDHTQYVKDAGTVTDNAIVRFNGTDGRTIQNSKATIDDNGNLIVTGYTKVTDYITAEGGLHVGGTSDPGTDNLVVDGTIKDGSGKEYLKTPEWQSYTVSWTADTTNPSIGNGTLAGRYTQIGKTCILIIGLTMGSTTTYGSGNWSFSLPKTAKNTSGINFYGVAHLRKVGTANYERIAQINPRLSTTVINMFIDPTSGSNSFYISATVPFTWGDGDALGIEITYEME